MYKINTKNGVLKKRILNILFIMRLTTIIILATMLQVSANTFAQKVTYVEKNGSLLRLFKEIKKQTGLNVIWSEDKLNVSASLNANFRKAPLQEVMKKALDDLDFTYVIMNRTIVIKEKEFSLLDRVIRKFQSIEVRGIVRGEDDEPLSGATIMVKGSTNSTTANSKGEFILQGVAQDAILVISYLGYQTKEIPAKSDLGIVKLEMSSSGLKEIEINAGYYTVKEKELTGSISRVSAETIERQPVDNPLLALQGNVPGVQVTQQTGVPGGGLTVLIRGQNSIQSGNDPLYIVDGVTYPSVRISGGGAISGIQGLNGVSPLSMINPNDIQSIEILKDADATAIYGSRGANGVILITTKKASQGDTRVNVGISQGFSQVGHHVDLLNTEQYVAMRKEAFKNDGLTPGSNDYDLNGVYDLNKYTDWQKELIGKNAPATNVSLNITGGSPKNSYLLSGNYYKEGTVFPGNFGFDRYSFRSNVNLGATEDRFNAVFTANYSHTQSKLLSSDLTPYILLAPNLPDAYDQYGNLNWNNNTVSVNPMAFLLQTYNSNNDNLVANITLSYKILKNLILKSSLGYTTIKGDELQKTPLASISPIYNYNSTNRVSLFGNNYNNSFIAEPTLTYTTKVTGGTLNALLGMSYQNNNAQLTSTRASGFNSDNLMEDISSAAILKNNFNNYTQYRYAAIFARLNYSLADKYFLNLTARRDGSSRFGPGRQYANFGAVGAAWIFSEEKFIKENLSFLSFGKLRASYGITGNDQITDFGYLQLWNSNSTYQGTSTITPGFSAPNANFGWETNRKLEGALQLGFLKDRLTVQASFYRNRSSNLLLFQTLPLSTGKGGLNENLPAEVQNKGWEFDANIKILKSQDWQWTTSFNLTIPRNKLIAYPGLETSSNAAVYKIGEPLSIIRVDNVTVDKQTGLYTLEDKNGDGNIDNDDLYLTKFLGPTLYGGLQNSIKYKQFNLDFLFSFTKQNAKSSTNFISPGLWLSGSPNNQTTNVLARWQQVGDNTTVQKFSTTFDSFIQQINAYSQGNIAIVDASYIKLRNVSLSYSFLPRWLSALKIKTAAISLQSQNVFTLTKYVGLDPETSMNNLPPLRTFMMGVNLTF